MGFLQNLFGAKPEPKPSMEHPTGEFKSAVEAMEDAVTRLRKLPRWEQWITFGAQGEGDGRESCAFAEIRMLGDKIDVGEKLLDITRVVAAAGVDASKLVPDGTHYSAAAATPKEVAQILDAIFRRHFGLRPFADEDDDYAVGAEW